MENLSKMFQTQKRKKTNMKRLGLLIQFKIEFLLPFTSCRKVLQKKKTHNGFYADVITVL